LLIAEDERFSSMSESEALPACKRRILELGEEVLAEIATHQDERQPLELKSR
jgi:hypothetical protein